MMNLDWVNIRGALVSTVLMAILAVLVYVISLGDIFIIEWRALINIGVISLATGLVSLIKSMLTEADGTIAGVKVK